jgi:hypothetical protein
MSKVRCGTSGNRLKVMEAFVESSGGMDVIMDRLSFENWGKPRYPGQEAVMRAKDF